MSEQVVLSINGRKVVAKPGERLIDVAKREGDYIPRFCYHPKLSVVASCRMCLVDIEGHGKAQPACSTIVANDMVVRTQSAKAIEAQKAIMQFLLINHPLHCPICDQGGECELQDTAMGYGDGVSEYAETKRAVSDEDLGPLVATDMSLCIHCTRCVRFGKEIAGVADLGFVGRGDTSQISTYLNTGLRSELSGNMIDLCPVGALTSKPFQFKGRSWGFKQQRGISPHDAIGSNINYHSIAKGYEHKSNIMRVIPAYQKDLNEGWLSDRDRFSYEGIEAKERLLKPMMKKGGRWETVAWEDILQALMHRMSKMTPDEKQLMGVWLSNQMTLEEAYLAQDVFRQFGVNHIDHCLWVNSKESIDCLRPSQIALNELKAFDTIVLVGANIRYEQPILSLNIKQACDQGTEVVGVGSVLHEQIFPMQQYLVSPQTFAQAVFDITTTGHELITGKVLYILGEEALIHLQAHEIQQSVLAHCVKGENDCIILPPGPNNLGMIATGCVPYQTAWAKQKQQGLSYQQMLTKPMSMMWLHQIDPMHDVSDPAAAYERLSQAFVVSVTSFDTPGIRDCADIMLPVTLPAETPGSYINFQGKYQTFEAATCPEGEAKLGWSIYQVLGSLLSLNTVNQYEELHRLVQKQYGEMQWSEIICDTPKKPVVLTEPWLRVGLSSWVRIDAQVRHAPALQAAYPVEESVLVHAQSDITSLQAHIPQIKPVTHVAEGAMVYEKGQVFYASSMGPVTIEGEKA